MMDSNQSVLSYLISKLGFVGLTKLTKLVYFSDLGMLKNYKKRMTTYSYKRYYYGPFSDGLREDLRQLYKEGVVDQQDSELPNGETMVYYTFIGNESDIKLSSEQSSYLDAIISEFGKLQASQLGQLSYKTKPMMDKKATPGGRQAWKEELILE